MDKKGAVEVDWIVSIGIFFIFLSFFFIYITPLTKEQTDASESLLPQLEEKIGANTTWNVQRVPLFIHSNISGTEPVIADFTLNWKNITFSDNTSFYREENKIIFVTLLKNNTNLKWITSSNEPYTQQEATTSFSPTANSLSIDGQRFRAEFNGLLTQATHFDRQRITEMNLSSGQPILTEQAAKESNFTRIAAKYKLSSPLLNHTTFIAADFPRLFNFINAKQPSEPRNITITATVHNYTHYFIDGSLSGPLNFTSKSCRQKRTDYIDFYDSNTGASFITYDTANISFCTKNNSLELSITLPLKNETRYDIIFHTGDYTKTLKYINPYKVRTGMAENLTGMSTQLFTRLTQANYTNLKKAWNYPTTREFSFQLLSSNNTLLLNYTPKSPGAVNIFTREFAEDVLDKYGNKAKHKVRIRGW